MGEEKNHYFNRPENWSLMHEFLLKQSYSPLLVPPPTPTPPFAPFLSLSLCILFTLVVLQKDMIKLYNSSSSSSSSCYYFVDFCCFYHYYHHHYYKLLFLLVFVLVLSSRRCRDFLNGRILIIAFLWRQLILQTSILRTIELSMFLTDLMYVLISFNRWLIRPFWVLKLNSLFGNLHINQILVDYSNNGGDFDKFWNL